ncbi:MAG: hypothetical protein E7167_04080 [Firmicutes bacterium]|nr:hypothetical protein [Bacillota bacterium]
MENIYENKELCAKCGGQCCKKGGCQYAPEDFENLKFDYLLGKLEEGYISIVSVLDFQEFNGRIAAQPFLYVKARNVNRPIVDLLSMRTSCMSLTETGCKYDFEHRPSGGVNLIPGENGTCHWEKDPMEFIMMWQPQQKVLRKLVKRLTGQSVESQLREDAYNLFKDIFARNFNGVAEEEIREILSGLHNLSLAFPEAFQKANSEHRIMAPNDPIYLKR